MTSTSSSSIRTSQSTSVTPSPSLSDTASPTQFSITVTITPSHTLSPSLLSSTNTQTSGYTPSASAYFSQTYGPASLAGDASGTVHLTQGALAGVILAALACGIGIGILGIYGLRQAPMCLCRSHKKRRIVEAWASSSPPARVVAHGSVTTVVSPLASH